MPCGGRLSRTSASGQGHTGFRGRQTGQTSARSEARGRHGLVSGHLVVLGKLVPPLDLATGQARVPLPGHAVVTGAALQLLAAASRAPAAIVKLNNYNIKTALYYTLLITTDPMSSNNAFWKCHCSARPITGSWPPSSISLAGVHSSVFMSTARSQHTTSSCHV